MTPPTATPLRPLPCRIFASRALWRNAAIWGVGVLAPGVAQAAELSTFSLPSEPVARAIERFAIQGGVSAALNQTRPCVGRSRAVTGALTSAQALGRMLPAGCVYDTPQPRTYRISGPPPAVPDVRPVSPPPGAVDELVVTAEKRVEPNSGRPFSVTVLPAPEIRRLGGRTFADIASQVPGVTVTNLGSGRNKIFIRGLSDGSFTGRTQSTVGLYLDDVPITYDAPDPDLRLVDVERVEILRGPQGTLYGSGSIGGVVKIVTNRPDPQAWSADLVLDDARTAHGAESTGFEAMLNAPILNGHAALRAVIYSDERGGYIDLPRRRLTDQNRSRRKGGRIAFAVEAPADWRLQAKFVRQTIDTSDAQYTQGDLGPLTRDTRIREPHDNDFNEVSLTATHTGQVADFNISTAYIEHGGASRYDATGAFTPFGISSAGAAFDDDRRVKLLVTEAVLVSRAAGPARWLVGLFGSSTDERNTATLTVVRGTPLSVYRRRDRLSEAAAYAEFSYDITPRWALTVGGRAFATRLSTYADGFDLTPAVRDSAAGQLKDAGFAPKVRLSYDVAAGFVAYAQVQEGYRSGGFDVPALPQPAPNPGVQRYRPDKLWNSEIGADLTLFDHTLVLRGALFHADWKSLQTDQYLSSGLPMTVNIGDGANTGLEASLVWKPDTHFQARATALIEDPQLTRAGNVFPATRNSGLPGVPDRMASADLSYSWTPWSGVRAQVSGQYSYVGRSSLTFDRGPINAMGGYGVARLAASLATRRWSLEAYVENLDDNRGNTFAFGNPFSRELGSQATPPRPRTVGVALGWGF